MHFASLQMQFSGSTEATLVDDYGDAPGARSSMVTLLP